MQAVSYLGALRVIDLSKALDPETESRRCQLRRFNTGGPIPDFHTDMDLTSHLGTHVECPYHHREDWPGVEGLPLSSFMGRAIYVNFEDAEPNAYISPEMLEKHTAGRLQEGDIFFIPKSSSLTKICLREFLLIHLVWDKLSLRGLWVCFLIFSER